MDYSRFIYAVKNKSDNELGVLYNELFQILIFYLRSRMNASLHDAEDCAQFALLTVIERIRDDALKDPKNVYSYLKKVCRNRYLRTQYENKRSNYQDNVESYSTQQDPFELLVSKEEDALLESCIEETLREDQKEYIRFWIKHPDARANFVSKKFNMSLSNVWVRKHRIIKQLSNSIRERLSDPPKFSFNKKKPGNDKN